MSACIIVFFVLRNYILQPTPSFPPTLLINLDSRPDRLKQIQHEFRDWPTHVQRISAVKRSPGYKGCSLSHLKCLQIAKEHAYPWVLIIEDDCILMDNAKQHFQDILPYLWNHKDKWDIFNGGLTHITNHRIIDTKRKIFEASGYTTHFYIIHKDVYDVVLKNHPIDPIESIDVYYAKNFRIWTAIPYIAKQRPSLSDIQEKPQDYTETIDKAELMLTHSLENI